jgi:hypothetical protein
MKFVATKTAEQLDLQASWRMCGLASMYPAFDRSVCAPGHHGHQRACDLITKGPQGAIWVISVRMRREDRSSISFLILSQTSAGKR